ARASTPVVAAPISLQGFAALAARQQGFDALAARVASAAPPAAEEARRDHERPIVLISCSDTKVETHGRKIPAADLYSSPLFKKSLAYARAITTEERIRILSARYEQGGGGHLRVARSGGDAPRRRGTLLARAPSPRRRGSRPAEGRGGAEPRQALAREPGGLALDELGRPRAGR